MNGTETEKAFYAINYIFNKAINFVFNSMPFSFNGGAERPSFGWFFLYSFVIYMLLKLLIPALTSALKNVGYDSKHEKAGREIANKERSD